MKRLAFTVASGVVLSALASFLMSCEGARVYWHSLPQIKSTTFSNPDNLWFVAGPSGKLMHSKDGGKSWSEIPAEIGGISQISFIDQMRGWAVNRDGEVFRTLDGGSGWHKTANLKAIDPEFASAEEMQFVDEKHGWIRKPRSIFRTQDGGITWERCFDKNSTNGRPGKLQFIDSQNGWVCSEDGQIYRTEDGGRSWENQVLSGGTTCKSVFFLNQEVGWASTWPQGGIYGTEDRGRNWRLQIAPIEDNDFGLDSIHFIDTNNGWAAGRVWPEKIGREPTHGLLLQTMNGGKTWTRVEVGENETFFSKVHFSDLQHGWVFSRDNVYRTGDGGRSWEITLRLPPVKGGP